MPAESSNSRVTSSIKSPPPAIKSILKDQAENLYTRCCAAQPLGYAFSLVELAALIESSSEQRVLDLADRLIDRGLFILCKSSDGQNEASWKVRERKQAEILQKFDTTERVIYERIAEAQRDGAWIGNIRNRTGVHEASIRKVVKDLKARNLIKEMRSVKAGQRKLLILYELEPSEASSGGPFYQDAELDEGLVELISFAVCRFVEERSWDEDLRARAETHTGRRHGKTDATATADRSRKRQREETGNEDESLVNEPRSARRKVLQVEGTLQHPSKTIELSVGAVNAKPKSCSYVRPLSYHRRPLVPRSPKQSPYPTSAEVFEHIQAVAKSAFQHVMLTKPHLEILLDMLVSDDRLERSPDKKYRAVRRSFQKFANHMNEDGDGRENKIDTGPTAAPCGKCPVFGICEVGGPAAPEKCDYFRDWLPIGW